eukprot:1310491-Amphidinium_carterae.1
MKSSATCDQRGSAPKLSPNEFATCASLALFFLGQSWTLLVLPAVLPTHSHRRTTPRSSNVKRLHPKVLQATVHDKCQTYDLAALPGRRNQDAQVTCKTQGDNKLT